MKAAKKIRGGGGGGGVGGFRGVSRSDGGEMSVGIKGESKKRGEHKPKRQKNLPLRTAERTKKFEDRGKGRGGLDEHYLEKENLSRGEVE